jgi:hypothetical protein
MHAIWYEILGSQSAPESFRVSLLFINFTSTESFQENNYSSPITMPVETLLNDVVLMKVDSNEKENMSSPRNSLSTPTAVVSPDHSNSSIVSSNGSEGSLDDDEQLKTDMKPRMTDHKLAELAGKHLPEPLLMENPRRFVLFPIQDNDVRHKLS